MRRIFGAALLAGLIAGLLVSLLQELRLVPLILAAEDFEAAGHAHGAAAHAHDAAHTHDAAWAPADGLERRAFTWLANIVTAAGFGLLLTAAYGLRGRPTDARRGLLWGLAGFAAFALAPALGLPPELPGAAAGDLHDRQVWWLATAAATSGGLALLAFAPAALAKAAGALLIAAPHLVGAPHPPPGSAGAAPPELAAAFAVASLVTAGLFWAALGALTGAFYRRFS
jgi:cobalt transporter subunit CbtA